MLNYTFFHSFLLTLLPLKSMGTESINLFLLELSDITQTRRYNVGHEFNISGAVHQNNQAQSAPANPGAIDTTSPCCPAAT